MFKKTDMYSYDNLNRKQKRRYLKSLKKSGYYVSVESINSTNNYIEFTDELFERLSQTDNVHFLEIENEIVTSQDDLKLHIRQQTEEFRIIKYSSNGEGSDYLLRITPFKNGIQLYMIWVSDEKRCRGKGQELMDLMKKVSDDLNIPVYLIPVNDPNSDIDYNRLVNFYKRNNYKKMDRIPYWKYEPNTLFNEDTIELTEYKMVS